MAPDAARFVERFQRHWSAPTAESFRDLFHPGGWALHPPGTEPVPYEGLVAYFNEELLPFAPGITVAVREWAAVDDVVLIALTLNCEINGEPLSLDGVDRFVLDADRAVNGTAYFDPAPLLAANGEQHPVLAAAGTNSG